MKRFLIFLVLAVGALGIAHVSSVSAQSVTMTEAKSEQIRAVCTNVQANLQQLHASDAVLRVNRGRVYESISTKLMAPLNSRISLAKLDSLNLTTITATYEQQVNMFRDRYQAYEETLSSTLKINCTNQPVAFYDSIVEVRKRRAEVAEASLAIKETIQKYNTEFGVFYDKFRKENGA